MNNHHCHRRPVSGAFRHQILIATPVLLQQSRSGDFPYICVVEHQATVHVMQGVWAV